MIIHIGSYTNEFVRLFCLYELLGASKKPITVPHGLLFSLEVNLFFLLLELYESTEMRENL